MTETISNRREHPRTPITLDIEIRHASIGKKVVKTKDISDSGIFILVEVEVMPDIGEIVTGIVLGMPGDAPIVTMEIVRTNDDGLGLRFISSTGPE